jgi:hypothetical protein
MRILSNADVEKVLTTRECMAALEDAYRELTLGQAANLPRSHIYFPVEDANNPGFRYRFKSQEGGNVSSGVWALRITSDIAGVETLANGVKRRRLIPAAPGGRYVGLVTLYSMTTLEPLAVLHDSFIQKMRVGAHHEVSGVVRIQVEHGVGHRAASRDEPVLVVHLRDLAERAFVRATGTRGLVLALDVGHPVRCPKTLEVVSGAHAVLLFRAVRRTADATLRLYAHHSAPHLTPVDPA